MGFDLSEEFGSNPKAEIEGVWVVVGEGAKVLIARLGNPQAQRAYRKIPRAVRAQIEDAALGGAEAKNFLADFMSKHVLLGWEGFSDAGKALKYSTESAKKMLAKHRRFSDRIWELTTDDALFNIADEAADAKN